jgi:DNA repair exonuclease SbcCD ATPase subunit
MLNVHTVELENFLSYEHAVLQFDREEPTIVIGRNKTNAGATSNGSGKTALFEGVLFGLFGKTAGGRHGDNAVKGLGQGCIVTVTGTSNGVPFSITRYRKHPIHKNKVNFLYGGKPVEGGSKKDTQDTIEEVLGINFDVLLQTCYFSPASIQTFCSMTDTEQKGIFQSILDLDKWEEASARVKAQEGILATKKTEARTELALVKQLKEKEIKHLLETLAKMKQVDTSDEEAKLKQYRDYITANKDASTKLQKLKQVVDNCRVTETKCTTEIYKLEKQVQDAAKFLSGTCPTCNSTLDTTVVQSSVDDLSNKIKDLQKQLSDAKELKTKASIRMDEVQAVSTQVSVLTGQVKVLESFLNSKLKLKSEAKKEVGTIRETIVAYRSTIKSLKSLLQNIGEKEALFKKLQVIFGTTGVKTYLIKQVLPHLNHSLANYSALICPNISVKIDAQKLMTTKQIKNKFDIQVVSPVGVGYKSLSSGEAKRVDLCIVFAFLDLIKMFGKQANFLILDEILDNLDQAGEDIAISMLKTLDQPNIFLISHKNSLAARFSNVLVVEKNNDTSTITIDE